MGNKRKRNQAPLVNPFFIGLAAVMKPKFIIRAMAHAIDTHLPPILLAYVRSTGIEIVEVIR